MVERLPTTAAGFRSRFAGTARGRVALETGTHSPWVSALLSGLGHEVVVTNPRKVRASYDNDSKSDRVDAEQLARELLERGPMTTASRRSPSWR